MFTADVTPRRVTARTNVKFTMSGSEVVHYDLPPLLVDTASPTTSGCVHVRHHEIQALRAVETHVLCPADPRYEATCSAASGTAAPSTAPSFPLLLASGVGGLLRAVALWWAVSNRSTLMTAVDGFL